jgi:alpha-ribazole phosphatase
MISAFRSTATLIKQLSKKSKMRIIFARHGQTWENKNDISQGQLPGKLTRNGKRQAIKLAKRLENERIDVVYCSDLARCKDTLEPLLKLRDVKVIYTKQLRERHNGIFQGKKHSAKRKWKEEMKKKFPNKKDFTSPGGESIKTFIKRSNNIIDKIIEKEKGKHVLIMSHGGTIGFMLLHLFQKPGKTHFKHYHPWKNTAVSIVHIKDSGRHHARLINCIKHLD